MAYRIEVIPTTLSHLQGHSPTTSLSNFSYSWEAVDIISTGSA